MTATQSPDVQDERQLPATTAPSAVARRSPREALARLERVVIQGDLSVLSDAERVGYYARVCESLGLNPLTRPFDYIRLNNKLVLYVKKDATDQLRRLHGVAIDRVEREVTDDEAVATVYGHDRHGNQDSDIGIVSLTGLKGEARANAIMKAVTKGKRRFTLSIVGLGWMDESEVADMVTVQPVQVDPTTGHILSEASVDPGASRTEQAQARAAALRATPQPDEQPAQPAAQAPTPDDGALDVDDIPFDQAPVEAGSVEAPRRESGPAASTGAACTHPQDLYDVRDSGIWCRNCGELVAGREQEEQPRERSYRERLNARIHVDRTHAQAKLLCAAVLGMDPHLSTWSMADLTEDQLAMVAGALEAGAAASRPVQDIQRGRTRRQPAGAGR